MKRIIFAFLFVALLVGLASLIPNSPSTAYPPLETPIPTVQETPQFPQSTPFPGLRINYSNCRNTSIEWTLRGQQFEVDYFIARFTNGFTEYDFLATNYWSNQDVEYWLAGYDDLNHILEGKVWEVQGIGYVPGFPGQEHYYTDPVIVNCVQILKRRFHAPGIYKDRH